MKRKVGFFFLYDIAPSSGSFGECKNKNGGIKMNGAHLTFLPFSNGPPGGEIAPEGMKSKKKQCPAVHVSCGESLML